MLGMFGMFTGGPDLAIASVGPNMDPSSATAAWHCKSAAQPGRKTILPPGPSPPLWTSPALPSRRLTALEGPGDAFAAEMTGALCLTVAANRNFSRSCGASAMPPAQPAIDRGCGTAHLLQRR
ncbi:hypothetical protein [Mangrovicoccus sp. HB161399]|uniref:hypothetical protein n=1 Tax=Mangrovicoccus sp. HB161399 TaxID=2720392 RepID=UPI0015519994|nr:hypothetical protein [Mangrovicoccus sp. HB161399]